MALIAYLLIGLPNVLVLALLAGVMEAIPLVGPLLGIIPAGWWPVHRPDRLVWVMLPHLLFIKRKTTCWRARHA